MDRWRGTLKATTCSNLQNDRPSKSVYEHVVARGFGEAVTPLIIRTRSRAARDVCFPAVSLGQLVAHLYSSPSRLEAN
jgi:hypothetical protein